MTTKMRPIPAGTFFITTSGFYSSHGVENLCRALVEIDVEALRAEYAATRTPENRVSFFAWLSAKGIFELIPAWELNLGENGDETDLYLTDAEDMS